MNTATVPKRLPIDVPSALHAICSTGKGRCWYCDVKLPEEARALSDGWDVQRIDEQPVASIILVCPDCLREPHEYRGESFPAESSLAAEPHRRNRPGATP